jgi:Family of unknown function (DUF5985)
MFEPAVYILCFLSSAACAWLLLTSYHRHRQPLLLWSGLCFCLLAVDSALVFIDIIILPDTDLLPMRQVTELLAIGVLLYAFVWESD